MYAIRSYYVFEQAVQVALGALFVLVQGVHELGSKDLLSPGVHLFLPGREALLHLTKREVAHNLRELEDVAGLDLFLVVFEAPVPVLRHVRNFVGKDRNDLV